MTVSSEVSQVTYDTDGVTTVFPVPFYFLANTNLRVWLLDPTLGTETELVYGSDYNVTGAGSPSGGTVTTLVAHVAGPKLGIQRIVPITQETAYQRNDPFPERAHERALDKLTMIGQQFESMLGTIPGSIARVLHFPTELPRRNARLPSAVARARKALIFDDNGNVTVGTDDYEDQAAAAAASAAAAAASATAAEEDRQAVEQVANDFGDLAAARDEWEAAVDQSQAAAASAEADANRAEIAANTALANGRIFDSTAQGLANTTDGQYFSVPSSTPVGYLDLYRNTGGTAVYVDTLPNAEAVDEAIQAAAKGYRHFPALPRLLTSFGDTGPAHAYAQDGVVIAGIDGKGRARGVHVPDDSYGIQLRRPAQDDKQIAVPLVAANKAVMGGWDGLGRLRAPMVPDDSLRVVLLRDFADPGALFLADAAGTIYARWPGEVDQSGGSLTGLFAAIDAATMSTTFIWPHGTTKMLRVVLRPNGHNSLYNVRSVSIAPLGDPALASWTTLTDTDTDWFPPMTFRAVSGGDPAATPIYTGGNHGGDGNDGGALTARMASWAVSIDGRPLNATESFSGYVDRVTVSWVNELMAYNTITTTPPRYCVQQSFVAHIRAGDIDTYATVKALEGIEVQTDNGLQMSATGYNQTCHFLQGQLQARTTYTAALNTNSGPRSTWPAWAISFGHADNGFQTSWTERTFGAGDGSLLAASSPFVRVQSKGYHGIVAGGLQPLATGASYQWHGGYCWSPSDIVAGLDSAFIHRRGNRPHLAWAFTAAGAGTINLPSEFVGSTVGAAAVGSTGLAVSAASYDVQTQPIQ